MLIEHFIDKNAQFQLKVNTSEGKELYLKSFVFVQCKN